MSTTSILRRSSCNFNKLTAATDQQYNTYGTTIISPGYEVTQHNEVITATFNYVTKRKVNNVNMLQMTSVHNVLNLNI
jgi:hypothetical protein